jgi:hypothetical protein
MPLRGRRPPGDRQSHETTEDAEKDSVSSKRPSHQSDKPTTRCIEEVGMGLGSLISFGRSIEGREEEVKDKRAQRARESSFFLLPEDKSFLCVLCG